jgi:hypothetical protein
MKPQTSKEYNPIGLYGCYFASLLHEAERITGKTLSRGKVMNLYAEAVCSALMGSNCFIWKPGKLCSLAIFELTREAKPQVSYVGWWNSDMSDDEVANGIWGGTPDFSIKRYRTIHGYHFVSDDYNPDPRIDLLELTGKRYFKVVK